MLVCGQISPLMAESMRQLKKECLEGSHEISQAVAGADNKSPTG